MTAPALTPPTHILTYGTSSTAGSPFRSKASDAVRIWGHWISGIGIAFLDLFILIFVAVLFDRFFNYDPLMSLLGLRTWGWGPPPSLPEVIGDCLKQIWPLVPFAALFFAYGFILRILAKPVDRDSKGACWAAFWLIAPWSMAFALLAFGSLIMAVGFGTSLFYSAASSGHLLFFLVAALAMCLMVVSVRTSYRLLTLARSAMEMIPLDPDIPPDVEMPQRDGTEPGLSLPKVRALNYMGRMNTPTNVRRITSRGVLLVGILCGLASLSMAIYFIKEFLDYLVPWGGPAFNLLAMKDAFGMTSFEHPLVLFSGLLFFPGIMIAFLSPLVRRGSTPASVLALLYAIFLIVTMFLAVPVLFCFVIFLMDIGRSDQHYAYALWFLLLPFAVIAILLLKDIAACLFWIIRHPTLEKAPVRFFKSTA